jgi:hypothetical protein
MLGRQVLVVQLGHFKPRVPFCDAFRRARPFLIASFFKRLKFSSRVSARCGVEGLGPVFRMFRSPVMGFRKNSGAKFLNCQVCDVCLAVLFFVT